MNESFVLYGITLLMMTPSPLQTALLGPPPNPTTGEQGLPGAPVQIDDDGKARVTAALAAPGFRDPEGVWTTFPPPFVPPTKPENRDTLRQARLSLFDDTYAGAPPHPGADDTRAFVSTMETLDTVKAS